MRDGSGPSEVTEGDICERFGWTFDELDSQDEDRVRSVVKAMSVRDSLGRIKTWQETVGKSYLSPGDMRTYQEVLEVSGQKEPNGKIVEPEATGVEGLLAELEEDSK